MLFGPIANKCLFNLNAMSELMNMAYSESPFGFWIFEASQTHIHSVKYSLEKPGFQQCINPVLLEAKKQLKAYFNRALHHFDLPLYTSHYPQYYQRVWKTVENIPIGSMKSYSDIALEMGDIKAVRAVGQANAKNPFPLIIPCHRVIGKNYEMTGYVYGKSLKKQLLAHEGAISLQFSLF